jgi:hypothetical protein
LVDNAKLNEFGGEIDYRNDLENLLKEKKNIQKIIIVVGKRRST